MRERWKRIGKSAAAVTFGVVLALALGELLLRAFWPQRSSVTIGMFEEDPFAGYRLRSEYRNYVRVPEYTTDIWTDAEGYRVPAGDAPASAAPEATRLLAIGDSFTFGVGVPAEQAFPGVLGRRLEEEGAGRWVVRNGGVGGYGPLRSSRLLFSRQAAWKPHVVVHQLYVGNDLSDENPEGYLIEPRIKDGRMVTHQTSWMRARLFLRIHSHLYSFVRERTYSLYQRTPLADRRRLDPIGTTEWGPWIDEVSWPAAREALGETADWCRENGVRYLVVIVPTRWQVDDVAWRQYREEWGLPDEAFDRDRAQREIVAHLDSLDVAVLDLLPELRARTRAGERFYYDFDPHWNAAGHAAGAEAIHEKLIGLGWVSAAGDSRREMVRAAP